jgi:hypothetical protein
MLNFGHLMFSNGVMPMLKIALNAVRLKAFAGLMPIKRAAKPRRIRE